MQPSTLQHPLTTDNVLIHLHIPKTGGVSLTSILSTHFETDEQITQPIHTFLELSPTNLAPYRLIAGHFTYNIQDVVSGNPIFVTMLRHPLDRIISFYHYVRSKPKNDFYFISSQVSFEEFIDFDNIAINWHVQNQMTAMLCGYDKNDQRPTEQDLPLAKARLKQMPFFGLTKFFQESMYLLHYTFNWDHNFEVVHRNATVNRPSTQQIPDSLRRRILDDNQLDLQLYTFAVALFRKRYRQMVDEIRENERYLYVETQNLNQINQDLEMKNYLLNLRNQDLEQQLHEPQRLTMLYRSMLPFRFRIFLRDIRMSLFN